MNSTFIIYLLTSLMLCFLSLSVLVYVLYRQSRLHKNHLNKVLESLLKNNRRVEAAMKAASLVPFVSYLPDRSVEIVSNKFKQKHNVFNPHINIISYADILENVHPDDVYKVNDLFNAVTVERKEYSQDIIRYDYKKRFENYYNITLTVEKTDESGNPITLIGFMQDVTDIKKAEMQLKETDKRLTDILDSMPFPVQLKDVEDNLTYRYWNKKSSELFGEYLHKTASDMVNRECAEKTEKIDIEVYNTGKTIQCREDLVLANGQFMNTIVNKSLLHSDGKKYVLIVRWDISQLVRLNADLEKALHLNQLIMDNINAGLIYVNKDFIVEWENVSKFPEAKYFSKYKPGSLCYESVYGRSEPCADCILTKAVASGKKVVSYTETKHEEQFEMTLTPVYNDLSDEVSGMVLRIDNIAERLRFISELESARDLALRSDKLKSAFLANMSHEIRTPLNAVVGFSELVAVSQCDEEKNDYVSIIKDNSRMLITLINDILDLSKIEAGFINLVVQEFDLKKLIINQIPVYAERLSPDVAITASLPPCPVIICHDKNRVSQVITNFVTNACKFTSEGNINIAISVSDNGVEVSVKDTGCGIEACELDKVFLRFEKLNTMAQGTGLGLSISKSIIDACGGTIGVESQVGKGSRFWFFLPFEN